MEIIRVKQILEAGLEYIRTDSLQATTPEQEKETWLYQLLNGVQDGSYDFYEQAKKIFLRGPKDSKRLRVALEFPKDVQMCPVIVLREPSRDNGDNAIGRETGVEMPQVVQRPSSSRFEFLDGKAFNFEVICVSVNMIESILLSEVIYSFFVGAYNTLAQSYTSISFGMKELMVNTQIIPFPVFLRSITLMLRTQYSIPSIDKQVFLNKVEFDWPNIIPENG
jgi:hypothetical protein